MRRPILVRCSVEGCELMRRSRRDPLCNRHWHLMAYYGSTDDPSFGRDCDHCGVEFYTTRSWARFCRTECRRARERLERAAENEQWCRIWVGACLQCGMVFVSKFTSGANSRYCSDACRVERDRVAVVEPVRVRPSVASLFTREEVFDRDCWVCQVCGESVPDDLEFPDPLSASLVHIVAPEDGGSHSFLNCQLAHLACRQSRGDGQA